MFSNNLLMAAAGGGDAGYVIEGSGLFVRSSSQYLSKTFGTATDRKVWTFHAVIKRALLATRMQLFSVVYNGSSQGIIEFDIGDGPTQDQIIINTEATSTTTLNWELEQLQRDPAAYIALTVAYDSTDATTNDRVKIYLSEAEQTNIDRNSTPAQNDEQAFNDALVHQICAPHTGSTYYFDGYVARVCFVDGQALTPTSFGEETNDGYWQINDCSDLTFGNNGFLLEGGTNVANGVDSSITSTTAVTINHEATSTNTANSTTDYTGLFDGIAIGTAAGDRIVQVCVDSSRSSAGARTVSTMTIGGIAAKLIKRSTTANGDALEIWAAEVPTGTTADIDVDMSASMDNMQLNVWSITGADFDSYFTISDTGTTLSQSTLMPLNSAFIGATFNVGNSGCTWTGATEEYDGNIEDGNDASGAYNTSGPNVVTTVTATMASAHAADSMAGVVWFPADGPLNHFTPSGTPTATNDSPTNDADNDYGNYATLSPIDKNSNITLSDGNLIIDGGTAQGYPSFGTQSITEGKYYYEFEFDTLDGTNAGPVFGFCNRDANDFSLDLVNVAPADYYTMRYWIGGTGYRVHNDTSIYQPNNDPTAAAGQLGAVAIDLDAGKGWFLIDDVIMADSGGTQGSIASGTNPCFTFTANTPMLPVAGATTDATGICNFGQTTFTNTPPTGFKALSTANMPDPAIPDPTEHHQVELVSHDGSSTNFTCNWDADTYDTLFIIKNRDSVEAFHWIDGVRGYNKYFTSETTDAWTTDSNVITVSGTTITLGSTLANDNYVVECHRAGASASRTAHTADVPPDLASTTSFNSVTGFCIMTWTGGGTLGQTINHGMGQAPDLFISSQDNASQNKRVYHSSIGATKYINLESTNGTATSSNFMNDTEPTASVISLGATGFSNNDSGASHVGYAWYSVEGNSAFGSYEGNASTDGSVVNVGIKPLSAFVKAIDSTDWWQKMETVGGVAFNGDCDALYYNSTYAETDEDANNGIDIISNGLKMRGAGGQINAAETYIYGIWGGRPIQGPAPASNTSQGRAR